MVAYRILGNNLVSDEEFYLKGLDRKLANAAENGHADRVMLDNGAELDFTANAVQPLAATPADIRAQPVAEAPALPDIGFGKPLTVEILQAAAGDLGSSGSKIALVSAVRNWGTTKASARGLNFVSKRGAATAPLDGPNALTDGTTIVAYQKAVTSRQINAAFEMGAASRVEEVATTVGGAFETASGIPLLMPYSGLLLAASKIIPLVGNFISSIAEGRMSWTADFDINLGRPTSPVTVAQKMIVAPAGSALRNYRYRDDGTLVGPGDVVYSGKEPYIVVAVHGFEDPELEGFTSAVATAQILKKFRIAQEGGGLVDDLLGTLKIASDVHFRSMAQRAKDRMKDLDPASDDFATAKAEFDAAVKNIQDPDLKPKT